MAGWTGRPVPGQKDWEGVRAMVSTRGQKALQQKCSSRSSLQGQQVKQASREVGVVEISSQLPGFGLGAYFHALRVAH